MSYQDKYLKYKQKYINLKEKLTGGGLLKDLDGLTISIGKSTPIYDNKKTKQSWTGVHDDLIIGDIDYNLIIQKLLGRETETIDYPETINRGDASAAPVVKSLFSNDDDKLSDLSKTTLNFATQKVTENNIQTTEVSNIKSDFQPGQYYLNEINLIIKIIKVNKNTLLYINSLNDEKSLKINFDKIKPIIDKNKEFYDKLELIFSNKYYNYNDKNLKIKSVKITNNGGEYLNFIKNQYNDFDSLNFSLLNNANFNNNETNTNVKNTSFEQTNIENKLDDKNKNSSSIPVSIENSPTHVSIENSPTPVSI